MVRRCVIVGHGPSLKGLRQGKNIDACDKVVRLKNCYTLLAEPHNYGTRTDAMCSSTEVLPTIERVKADEYWGYPKKGTYNKAATNWLQRKTGKVPHVPLELCNFWNCFFLELGGKHPNVSTGMAAMIIALDRYKPDTLVLAGFDKVLNPATPGYACTVPTPFNSGGTKDTGHDWGTEHKMLPYLAQHFNCRIEEIGGKLVAKSQHKAAA